MDLEGIIWIGNTYQKLEAVCLEVEEIIYKDTVKYVESQVQTVGDSMKRFYSDVMLDLLHPSLTDPGKRAYTDLPAEPDVDTGIYLKPMVGKKVKDIKVVDAEKRTEDLSIVGEKVKDTNAVNDKMPPPVFHDLHCCDHPSPPCQRESAGDYSLVELEIIQPVDEETCVMVNEDEFQSVPHNEVHSRVSKKMWDVFSSRKSMMRKEYEKLAEQHGGDSKPDHQVSAEELMSATAAERSTTSDPCESEWELI